MRPAHLLALALLIPACSSSDDRAPAARNDCLVPPCSVAPPPTGGGAGGGSGTGGSTSVRDGGGTGGAGGSSSVGDAGLGVVSGAVAVFDDTTFVPSAPFTGAGAVGVFDETGPDRFVEANLTGGSYTIDGPSKGELWVTLSPRGAPDVLPTITQVLGGPEQADVAFARTSAMNLIFSGLLTAPQLLLSSRAQVVLRFVTGTTGEPVNGVEVAETPAAGAVAYDNDALYTDLVAARTQSRGVAVVLNMTGGAWPGTAATIRYRFGNPAIQGTTRVFAAQGAVTIATVRLPL